MFLSTYSVLRQKGYPLGMLLYLFRATSLFCGLEHTMNTEPHHLLKLGNLEVSPSKAALEDEVLKKKRVEKDDEVLDL